MTLLTKVREQIVPITIEAVILSIGFFTFMKMPPQGTAADIFAWFLLLAAFCVVFSLFPAIAIIYGWYTGDKVGAALAGALPLPLFFITVFFLFSSGNMVFIHNDTIIFIVILSAICGFAGYCAAQRMKPFLALSILLTGLWLIIWMKGFN